MESGLKSGSITNFIVVLFHLSNYWSLFVFRVITHFYD